MNKEKIIIERKKRFSESSYSVGIYVNNEFIINTIKENRQELELTPGKYIIKAKQGYRSGETEIEVKKGKIITYQFSATPYTYIIFFLFLFAVFLTHIFEFTESGELFLFIPGVIATIYTFTSGRNKYFVFKKLQEEDCWMDN